MKKCVGIILAGGNGVRAAFGSPKQLVKLGGRPMIAHALERFQTHPGIDEIAIVTNSACIHEIEAIVSRNRLTKVRCVLLGGEERYESSLAAIRAYAGNELRDDLLMLFHDAVRPLVSHAIISRVISALEHYGAVDTAVAATDTVVLADPATNTIREIPDRRLVRLGQTPQGFHYDVIRRAYEKALLDPAFRTTDDCGVVARYLPEQKVYIVDGESSNLKLTYADDLMVLDKFMQSSAGRRLRAAAETMRLSCLDGRTIVIFGGTSGIGAAMAKLASAYGATVHAVGRSTGTDVADPESVAKLLDTVASSGRRIDAVVNAAAVLDRRPLANMSAQDVLTSVNTNILGAINVAQASYEHLRASAGHLLMFASSSYTYGRAFYSTYSASKAAVVNLVQALADEWCDVGIRVNCVNPERARTPMRTRAFGLEPADTLLDPEDVARKALSVLTDSGTGLIYDIAKTSDVRAAA
jgi:2-C-methyl-D-erythritol 4-phosphate cytidylyltransferase